MKYSLENRTILPSDIGLKELEIFYNSQDWLQDEINISFDSVNRYARKTAAIGAFSFMSFTGISEQYYFVEAPAISISEKETKNYSDFLDFYLMQNKKEISFILSTIHIRNFTEEEREEMEIIDAYYKEVRPYYPLPKKFIL